MLMNLAVTHNWLLPWFSCFFMGLGVGRLFESIDFRFIDCATIKSPLVTDVCLDFLSHEINQKTTKSGKIK